MENGRKRFILLAAQVRSDVQAECEGWCAQSTKTWCADSTKTWDKLCKKDNCADCAQCDTTTPPPEEAGCKSWCATSTKPGTSFAQRTIARNARSVRRLGAKAG